MNDDKWPIFSKSIRENCLIVRDQTQSFRFLVRIYAIQEHLIGLLPDILTKYGFK